MSEPTCTGRRACSRCGVEQHALAFSAGSRTDGTRSWCRECERQENARNYSKKKAARIGIMPPNPESVVQWARRTTKPPK